MFSLSHDFHALGLLFSVEKWIQGAVSTSAIITYNQKALICRRGEVNWTTKETLVQQRPGNLTGGSKVGLLRSLPARGVFIYWSASSLCLNLLNSFDYVLKMMHMKQTNVYTICAHLAEQRKHFYRGGRVGKGLIRVEAVESEMDVW